jgi:hypothetical protein
MFVYEVLFSGAALTDVRAHNANAPAPPNTTTTTTNIHQGKESSSMHLLSFDAVPAVQLDPAPQDAALILVQFLHAAPASDH